MKFPKNLKDKLTLKYLKLSRRNNIFLKLEILIRRNWGKKLMAQRIVLKKLNLKLNN